MAQGRFRHVAGAARPADLRRSRDRRHRPARLHRGRSGGHRCAPHGHAPRWPRGRPRARREPRPERPQAGRPLRAARRRLHLLRRRRRRRQGSLGRQGAAGRQEVRGRHRPRAHGAGGAHPHRRRRRLRRRSRCSPDAGAGPASRAEACHMADVRPRCRPAPLGPARRALRERARDLGRDVRRAARLRAAVALLPRAVPRARLRGGAEARRPGRGGRRAADADRLGHDGPPLPRRLARRAARTQRAGLPRGPAGVRAAAAEAVADAGVDA